MLGYIFVLIAYSFFNSYHVDIKRVPVMLRPIGFAREDKIDAMRILIAVPVFIAFVLAFTIIEWTDVLIYTLAIRLGIFAVLTIIPSIFPIVKRFNGHLFFISFILSIIALIYYYIVEFIV